MKIRLLIILIAIAFVGCSSQKSIYFVEQINDDKCTETYFRLKLKKIDNSTIFQVLSAKDSVNKVEINEGDTIKIALKKISRKEYDPVLPMRPPINTFHCDDELILEEKDCFYRSKNLKGLRISE